MHKLSIISVEAPGGGHTGWLKDNPGVIAEGETHVELVGNLIEALQNFTELEKESKN